MVVVSSSEIPGIGDALLVEILSEGKQNRRLLRDINTRADLRYKEAVTLRYKVKGIRADVVGVLRAVLKAIRNQGGGDDGGPAGKKRRSGRISGGGNPALNEMARNEDEEDE